MASARAGVVGAVTVNNGADVDDPRADTSPASPFFWSGMYFLAAVAFIVVTAHGFRGARR